MNTKPNFVVLIEDGIVTEIRSEERVPISSDGPEFLIRHYCHEGLDTFHRIQTDDAGRHYFEYRRTDWQGLPSDIIQAADRELATILAALRYWQREGWTSCGHEQDIASDGGILRPLSTTEIDVLCERLNCEGSRAVEDNGVPSNGDELEIAMVLITSTAHATADEAQRLSELGYDRGDCGWFFNVPMPDDEPLPGITPLSEGLTQVICHARTHGCRYVLLDPDAEPLPDVPAYNW